VDLAKDPGTERSLAFFLAPHDPWKFLSTAGSLARSTTARNWLSQSIGELRFRDDDIFEVGQ
jgi:hypothetical protein